MISRTYRGLLEWFRLVSGEVVGRLKGKGPFELKLAYVVQADKPPYLVTDQIPAKYALRVK